MILMLGKLFKGSNVPFYGRIWYYRGVYDWRLSNKYWILVRVLRAHSTALTCAFPCGRYGSPLNGWLSGYDTKSL